MHAPALRELRATDRAPIAAILHATGAFTDEEVGVALELVDEGLVDATTADAYRFVVAELDGRVVGYACFGLTPLTDGVFDVYWIAVDPACQGRGVGKALLRAVEAEVTRRHGRTILIETGGKPSYAATRTFYDRAGYREIARIPDFFRIGDDKVVYARRVDGQDPRRSSES